MSCRRTKRVRLEGLLRKMQFTLLDSERRFLYCDRESDRSTRQPKSRSGLEGTPKYLPTSIFPNWESDYRIDPRHFWQSLPPRLRSPRLAHLERRHRSQTGANNLRRPPL